MFINYNYYLVCSIIIEAAQAVMIKRNVKSPDVDYWSRKN